MSRTSHVPPEHNPGMPAMNVTPSTLSANPRQPTWPVDQGQDHEDLHQRVNDVLEQLMTPWRRTRRISTNLP